MNNTFKYIILCIPISLIFYIGCGDYSEQLSGGYTYNSEGDKFNIIYKNDHFIPCDIISFDYNDDFIIAAQVVQQDQCQESKINPMDTIGTLNFWIIIIKKDQILGPLNYKAFIEWKKKLSINNTLTLDFSI
jgi:hypothetical protein